MPDEIPEHLDLTILILCLNEEKSIAHCVAEARDFLARAKINGEVLVLDNGSTDRSADVARAAGARVVIEHRKGYGNATIAGISASRGIYTILGDGDGEHNLNLLEPFWDKLQNGYDLVVGNRFKGGVEPGAMRFLNRYVGNPFLSGVGRLFFSSPAKDFHCGLRGFRTSEIRMMGLQSSGMELASEMIVKAVLKNMRITEVPVSQRPALDPERVSHLKVWRDGWNHLRLLLMLSPRWVFLYPGILMLIAGLFFMTAPIVYPLEAGGIFGAYTMLFGSGFWLCGMQLVTFALIANLFAERIGLSDGSWTSRLLRYRVLEKTLVIGFILALLGIVGSVWSLFVWAQTDGGDVIDIETRLRIVVPSITLLISAVQLIFSGFLTTSIASHGAAWDGASDS